jgi:hypothetical protein
MSEIFVRLFDMSDLYPVLYDITNLITSWSQCIDHVTGTAKGAYIFNLWERWRTLSTSMTSNCGAKEVMHRQ